MPMPCNNHTMYYGIIVVYPDYSIYSVVYSTASTEPISFDTMLCLVDCII